jgi:8-oxo-(d)GTP phosphatase
MDALSASSTAVRVRAAGGVVWRRRPGAGSGMQIAVVHRPRYDDWSLPKGKLRRHEHPLVGACREVEEETGVHARAVTRLPTVEYLVRDGEALVDKVVDYWAMAVVSYGPEPDGVEVDAVSWLGVDAALQRLSYDHDAGVVEAFARLPALRGPVVVVRPVAARQRGWSGPDSERPLGTSGTARARKLAAMLACYAPVELVSAPIRRCIQTLEPLRQRLGIPIRIDATLDAAGDRWADRARDVGPVVICTTSPGKATGHDEATGAGWAFTFAGDRLAAIDELA